MARMSPPAQKNPPAPVRTTARASCSAARSAASRSALAGRSSTLRRSGRLRVIRRTLWRSSVRIRGSVPAAPARSWVLGMLSRLRPRRSDRRLAAAQVLVVVVEAPPRLAPEGALLDEARHGSRRRVGRVPGFGEAGLLRGVADVDAGQVHQLERTHRVPQGEAAGLVDRLDARVAALVEAERLVAHGVQD